MKKLEWSNSLSLDIPVIDNQHKAIFVAINRLLESFNEGKEAELAFEVLAFVEEYVNKHFATEEFYLKKYAYADYENHAQLHKNFTKRLQAFKDSHRRGGLTKMAAVEMQEFLIDWWVVHIQKVDSKYASLLKNKM